MGKRRQYGENEMEQLKNASTDSRKKSLVEPSLDIFLGFLKFLPVNYFVLPLLVGPIAEYNILTAIQIGIMFSTISLIRKFALRRWFERMSSTEWNGLRNFLKDSLQIKNSAA